MKKSRYIFIPFTKEKKKGKDAQQPIDLSDEDTDIIAPLNTCDMFVFCPMTRAKHELS